MCVFSCGDSTHQVSNSIGLQRRSANLQIEEHLVLQDAHDARGLAASLSYLVLGSLLELVHVDTVESFARRLRSRGLLPVSSLVLNVDTILHCGGCPSVRRRRERLAHLRAWYSCHQRALQGMAFRVHAIFLVCATIWSGLTWMWAGLQMTLPLRKPMVSSAAYALAVMMMNECHISRGLLPFRVLGLNQSAPSVVFILRLVGWLKRGVTLCFVTRKRLNSSVLNWVLSDLSQIPHWCDALLDAVNLCIKPVRRE